MNMNTSTEAEDLLSQWRQEQHEIASQTNVPADDLSLAKICPGGGREYSYLSPTIQDKLIGGVDVSFGDDNLAIAVYVITRNHKVLYEDKLMYTLTQPYVSSYLGEIFV